MQEAWDNNWLRQCLADTFVLDPAATLLLPNGVHGDVRGGGEDRRYAVIMSAQFEGQDRHMRCVHTMTFSSPLCTFNGGEDAFEICDPTWTLVSLECVEPQPLAEGAGGDSGGGGTPP